MALAAPDANEYGEVFTRRWIVEAILDLIGYTDDLDLASVRIVEPSVGSGAFVGPIVERLIRSSRTFGRSFSELSGALFAMDLQEVHVEACRNIIRRILQDAGATKSELDSLTASWLHTGDFLLDSVPDQVDFVVGNPPYIRTEDLDDATEIEYRNRWTTMRGRADIYVGFYERGLEILREGGALGFICADRWMRNAYGQRLRKLVVSKYSIDTVWQMHDVNAFETEVSAYPAITVLSNRPQGPVALLDTNSKFDAAASPDAVEFSRGFLSEGRGEGWSGARLANWFETDDFWPYGSPHTIRLLERLEEKFGSIESDGRTRIRIGIATGADKAYIHSASAPPAVEPDRLLPIVMADDIRTGTLKPPTRILLNPWDANGSLIELEQYPKFAFTLGEHPSVRERFVARKNPDTWHRTIDRVAPGIAEQPKLLLQDMKARITPVFEPGGYYPHHNLYYITSDSWDLEVLGGLLMSDIAESFISAYGVKMRGGTLRFQAQYLRKIVVPEPESISPEISRMLKDAFQRADRSAANAAARIAYGLADLGSFDDHVAA